VLDFPKEAFYNELNANNMHLTSLAAKSHPLPGHVVKNIKKCKGIKPMSESRMMFKGAMPLVLSNR
jgi:hypothetical protein